MRATITFNSAASTPAKINLVVFNSVSAITGFSYVSGQQTLSSSPSYNPDTYSADGSKYYDIEFNYDTANAAGFYVGENSVYDIFGSGITVNTFQSIVSNTNKGAFYAATHINEVAGGISGHYGATVWPPSTGSVIPEPGTVTLWLAGLLCVAGRGFRRKRLANC